MARNFARSRSCCDSSSASASTRALKSCQESSRLKYRSSGSVSTGRAEVGVTAGGADGTAWKSCAGRLAEPPRVARFFTGGTRVGPLGRDPLGAFSADVLAFPREAGVAPLVAESAVAGVVPSSLLTAPIVHHFAG